ncbi:YneF family protein [Paenibacillus sp. FSL R10-2734]|uniref:YneF family protein n=1 Tax=Paenibacillus sp. FSL R10-2734 TaxID=2954691 RepID=UPI0030D8F262
MNIALPIITLVVGLIGGFFIGVYYLRRQMTTMQNDPEMLQKVAKQMGYNLNGKQMQRAQQMMKNQNPNQTGARPGAAKGNKRRSK